MIEGSYDQEGTDIVQLCLRLAAAWEAVPCAQGFAASCLIFVNKSSSVGIMAIQVVGFGSSAAALLGSFVKFNYGAAQMGQRVCASMMRHICIDLH